MDFRIPIGQWVETVVDWLRDNLSGLFDFITVVVRFLVDGLTDILLIIPIPAMIVVFALIGWLVRSWQMAVGTVLAFVFIIAMDLWIPTMQTLSLVLVATVVALAIAIPLGIWSARNDTVRTILKPVLDFMQTMPAFVYLIPAAMLFGLGRVPGIIATVIFAMPPAVRLTNLGIRQVNKEIIEAGQSFGCTPRQLLFKVQLPNAMPSIMAGVNQTIMMSLAMVVIASLVSAPGLGVLVLRGIRNLELGVGLIAGLGIVLLAVILDRVTKAALARVNAASAAQRNS